MAAETDPKLIEEIDGIVPQDETTPGGTPETPGPVNPNGGPYQTQTQPQPAN
ncbi:MAG TPA: hypothetical protein VNO31_14600 [Umezawaea sp.]|nr:hypothetical protein [Umezawaea sp.]